MDPVTTLGVDLTAVVIDGPEPGTGPLPRRHPAAGRRFDGGPDVTQQLAYLRRNVAELQELLAENGQRLTDALARLRDYERAEATGACVGCLGHQRVIAEMKAAAKADRRRIAELGLTLRSFVGAVAHAEAHRELAAEGRV